MVNLAKYGPWALVTGASSGIGETFARQLAAGGFNLFLSARREKRLKTLKEELEANHGVEVKYAVLDLTEDDAVERLNEVTTGCDIGLVVDNAGFGYMGRFLDQEPERLAAMVKLNCTALMLVAHRFAGRLVERGKGGLVITASIAAFQATPYMAVYGATKGFDLLFGEGLAWELKDTGVDLLVLNPGATNTEFGGVAGSRGDGSGGMAVEPVVKAALQALGRKGTIVTGFANKISAFTIRFLPRRFVNALSASAIGRMVPREKR